MKKSLLIGFLILVAQTSFCQITGVAAAVALDKMESTMSGVIEDAENSGNSVINNGALQVNTTIYNFRETYKDVLKSSDTVLDQQAYNIFLNIKKATDKISSGATDFVAELDNTVANLHSVMITIPGTSKKPYISKSYFPILIKSSNFNEYEIQFTGSLLDQKSKFTVNGEEIKASEISTNRLIYHLEAEQLEKALEGKRANFNLEFRYGGLFKKLFQKTAKYNYFTKVVPLEFGAVDLQVSTTTNDTLRISRSHTFPETRTGGTSGTGSRRTSRQTFLVGPSIATNIIDVRSVRLETLENRYGYGASVQSATPAGITVIQHARSENEPFGGGGKVHSLVKFTELQITPITNSEEVQEKPFVFNEPLVIQLPRNTVAIQSIRVKLYDGKTVTLTTENINRNFEVDFRKHDSTLFIKNVKL
ncbi:hypothetical protein ACXYMU_03755 [Pontibacter sp. CAU 1760]